MRLLYTIPDFWPHVRRGSERLVHDLSVLMSQRGHSVSVLTRATEGSQGTMQTEGFQVEYSPFGLGLGRRCGFNALEMFAFTAMERALIRPADIHHAFYLTDLYGLARAKRWRRRPLIFSWHGIPDRRWWAREHPRTHKWYMRALEDADRITVMTEASAVRFREDHGFDPVVLTPGTFVDAFSLPRINTGPPTIVCAAATDDPRKRIDVLVDSFELLATEDREVRLLLVGKGNPTRLLAHLARLDPAVAARVLLQPEADLAQAYQRATVGALTSEGEAFGLAVVEYLAAGLPAVVSNDGGPAEIISPGTGLAFAVADAEACAAALRRALEMAQEPETEGRCRDRAREYDWSRRARGYERLYQELG